MTLHANVHSNPCKNRIYYEYRMWVDYYFKAQSE